MSQNPSTCPNRMNHVSGSPGFGRSPCFGGCGMYIHTPEGYRGPAVFRPKQELPPLPAPALAPTGEVVRYVVTMNADKYWTVRLAKSFGGGWLARDKDLAVALRVAAEKLEANAKTGATI